MKLSKHKSINFILFFILFTGISFQITAQNIKGRVINNNTEALIGATIVAINTEHASITDFEGKFDLGIPPGSYTLKISYLGYEDLTVAIDLKEGQTLQLNDLILNNAAVSLDELVVLGTRRKNRTVIKSTVPIDVIGQEQIVSSGTTQTVELLQSLIPSLTSFKNSITDGTDYVRPFNLRGLGSEHVLVLVNGKRRHISPVVNDNEQARGSVNVDLNSIPPSAIERIEVLRDGASAQYGSDAIAGVVNIVLKKNKKLNVTVTAGQNLSTERRGYAPGEGLIAGQSDADFQPGLFVKDWVRTEEDITHTDGESLIVGISKGFDLGKGNINASLQFWKQGRSDRAGLDPVYQYFGTLANGEQTGNPTELDLPDTTIDPREASFDRENWWFGKSELTDISGFINAEYPITDDHEVYLFGGVSRREGRGPCFWREPRSNNNVRSIRPDGYLPNITPILKDYSGSAGIKGSFGKWNYDLSESVGFGDFNFRGETLNVSLGDNQNVSNTGLRPQTDFDGGGTRFLQASTNIDISRSIDINLASPLNLAFGSEFRYESYEIYAGEPAAFTNGGVPIIDGPNAGGEAIIGTQCVPSFSDLDATTANRSNISFYTDLETDIIPSLTIGVAGRFENYSDFGSTVNGKLSGRWEITEGMAIRSSTSTGFRAPALAQQNYSNRSLQPAGDGSLQQTGTFPVDTEIARAIGARELNPEKATNISGGITYNTKDLSITIDAYQTNVNDRIILSEQFAGIQEGGQNLLANFLETIAPGSGITQVNYFTNGLDTRTRGLDILINYNVTFGGVIENKLGFTVSANFNSTRITNEKQIETPEELTPFSETPLLGHSNQVRIENSAPSSVGNFIINYERSKLNVLIKSIYYGEITASERFANNRPEFDHTYGGQLINDMEVSYKLMSDKLRIAVGSNNLFNIYPEKRFKSMSRNGVFPYSGFVPYGFTGRYVYTRLNFIL
ncbi:TonB-dependent receptor [Aquimarina sp. RZ0]|uniref:TonB-dependent receptor n=1 Tax=Aquimarina sp. RZ0 TaxID=2607730 RepID=UPI0011F36F5F|nr:TonB-dependent receptor [Aquimarina sp. RZ0]KAA1245122.1 TonB-dependent receptor [Aquimarina sp. RZ0]